MTDINFSQPERRSFLIPGLIAFVALSGVFLTLYWITPSRNADVSVTHIAILPVHTVFKTDTNLVGAHDPAQDDLYVLATVRIEDKIKFPLFIKEIGGTLTPDEGEAITSSAAQKDDLPNLYITFPKLKPLAGPPLLRETTIPPGGNAEGMVLLHFPVPQSTWDQRKSAVVTIGFYHQDPIAVMIPKL